MPKASKREPKITIGGVNAAAEKIVGRRYEIGIPELQMFQIQKAMGVWTIFIFDDAHNAWVNCGIEAETAVQAIIELGKIIKPHAEFLTPAGRAALEEVESGE